MSKNWPHRPPAVFRLDDDHVMVGLAKDDAAKRAVQVIPEPDTETSVIAVDDPLQWPRRRFRWGALFWGAVGGLILLAAGLGVVRLIEDLFARNQEFGFLGLALAIVAAVAFLVVVIRETMGLARLATIEKLHRRAWIRSCTTIARKAWRLRATSLRSRAACRGWRAAAPPWKAISAISSTARPGAPHRARTHDAARSAGAPHRHRGGNAGVGLHRGEPARGHRRIVVFGSALLLVRRLSLLYGARPGALGLMRLMRLVVVHLAMTGRMACPRRPGSTDARPWHRGQIVGAARRGPAQRFLTARLGLAAMDVVRPLPFTALPRPTLRNLMSDVLRGFGEKDETP